MKEENFSPEEKLLRLIKGQRKPKSPQENKKNPLPDKAFSQESNESTDNVGANSASANSAGMQEKNSLSNYKPISFGPVPDSVKGMDPFKVGIFLLAFITAISFIYLIFIITTQDQHPDAIDIEQIISSGVKQPKSPLITEKKPQQEDLQPSAELRELFGAPVTREAAPLEEQGPSAAEMAADLALVGVIMGDDPQAIISDKKSRQTFYVSEGESVLEFKVQKVDKAVVILEYKQETLKLSL